MTKFVYMYMSQEYNKIEEVIEIEKKYMGHKNKIKLIGKTRTEDRDGNLIFVKLVLV